MGSSLRLVALALIAAAPVQAQEILSDPGTPGEWAPAPWNSARGELSVVPEFPATAQAAPEERRSLFIRTSWGGDGQFRFYSIEPRPKPAPIPFPVTEVGLWVKGSGTGHSVEVHFDDAKGKDVKVGLGSTAAPEWRRLAAKVPADLAQPLTLRSITLHNWSARQVREMVCHVARLEVVVDRSRRLAPEGDPVSLSLSSGAENGLASDEGRAPVALKLACWDPRPRALEIRTRLSDWEDRPVQEARIPLSLEGRWSQNVALDLPRCGAFTYAVEARDVAKGEVVASARRQFAHAVPVPLLKAAERAGSAMGVNGHHATPWATLARLGIHWGRDYSWGWLEKGETAPLGKGVDFRNLWQSADAAGITLLPVTQGAFRNAANTAFLTDTGAIREAYTRLGKAFPEVPYWELDNEAEYHFPGRRFDMENYRGFIQAAAAGLRAAGKARVALNGTAGIRHDDTVALLKSRVRDDFTVVNSHYYTGTVPPELASEDINVGGEERRETLSFLDQMRRVNRLAHAAGKESWLTEIGWDVTNTPAVGERLQAVYLPRVFLLARLCGTDKVFWYYDRDVPGSKQRFGTCGLVDLNGDVRPSGVAMAALSRFTARAEVAGSVDLGADRWCVLLREPAGTWIAAVWSVEGRHPLPRELAGAEAFDLFGNSFRPTEITPEIAYFRLAKLPAAWEAQRLVEWLGFATLLATPGAGVEVEVRSPDPATTTTWQATPPGVTAGAWVRAGDRMKGALACAPDLRTGTYPLLARASGAGWTRRWPVTLAVLPPLRVGAEPYTPGELVLLRVRAAGGGPAAEARVEVPRDQTQALPERLAVSPDREQTVAILPADTANGAIPITFRLASGALQQVWLRPSRLEIPRVAGITLDGRLGEWRDGGRIDGRCLASPAETPPGEAWLGWSPEGLWLAARITVKELRPYDPRQFWDTTNVELLVDPTGEAGEGWGPTAHQFWLCPAREGDAWRLYAGEWKRGGAIAATVYDDRRLKSAMRYEDGTLTVEALFPPEALGGRAPRPGESWRAAISLRAQEPTSAAEAAWPRLKAGGLMDGTARWGEIRFIER